MLDQVTIQSLYASKASKPKQRKPLGKVLTSEGWQTVYKKTDYDYGAFEGRVGSIRRSRKGATRRLANGRRYYINVTNEVVAYKLT